MTRVDGPGAARPEVKASFAKSILSAMGELDGGAASRVLGRLPAEVAARIEAASRADWLDGETLITIDLAIHDELGPEGLIRFWRTFAATATRVPILRPIANSAVRIFGSPRGILKLLPRSWTLLTRHFGQMVVEETDARKRIRVSLVDVPPLSRPDLLDLGHRGSYLGVLDLVGATGTVTSEPSEITRGRYRYEIEWE